MDEDTHTMAGRVGTTIADPPPLAGGCLRPGDDGYESARRVWNAMVDRRPRLIARCADAADVATAVRFARDRDLEIGVRCGGHGVLGPAVPDGGLMIDLTPLGRAVVDPVRRRARVQGGALLGALDRATQVYGLATTAGNVSHTGVGGLALGGGMGWLARRFGLTCDNLLAADVVTADGELHRAGPDTDPDLLWGLRGGGGNFGVVTEFEFALHHVGTAALSVELDFLVDDAMPALRAWRDLLADAPRQATLTAQVADTPAGPLATLGFVWVGDPAPADRLLARLPAPAVARRVAPMTYLQLQTREDSVEGHASRRYWKGHYLGELSDAALEAFLLRGTTDGRGEHLPTVGMQAYGGAIVEVPAGGAAFAHRDTVVEYIAAAGWTDPAQDQARMSAARDTAGALDGYASGAYVNTLSDEGAAGGRRAYPPDTLARLIALKRRHDPDNLFHRNHNIVP